MFIPSVFLKRLFPISLCLLIAACGGGGGSSNNNEPDPQPEVSFFAERTVVTASDPNGTGDEIYHNTAAKLAAIDLNNDGFDDVLATYPGYKSADITTAPHTKVPVRVFLQDGAGGLTQGNPADFFGSNVPESHFTREIIVADFNGDGKDDFFLANHGLEIVYDTTVNEQDYWGEADTLMLSTPSGVYTEGTVTWVTKNNFPFGGFWEGSEYAHYTHGGSSGDFDSDGDIDLIVNTTTGAGSVILVNDGLGNFVEHTGMPQFDYGGGYIVNAGFLWSKFADINGDGNVDIVGTKAAYLNNGNNNFDASLRIDYPDLLVGREDRVEVGDIDSDGDIDVIVQNVAVDDIAQIFVNDGLGNFTKATDTTTSDGLELLIHIEFDVMDLDNDGDVDIVSNLFDNFVEAPNQFLVYLQQDGKMVKVDTGITVGKENILVIDLGADGDYDVVASADGISYFEALKTVTVE